MEKIGWKEAAVAETDEMCENSDILQGWKLHCTIPQCGETRSYMLEAYMKMDASQTVNIENVGPYLFSFELKLSNQMENKAK